MHPELVQGLLVRLLPSFQFTNTTFDEGMQATLLSTPSVPTKIRLFLDFVAARVSGESSRFTAAQWGGGTGAPWGAVTAAPSAPAGR